jgi:hypothetical protein
VWQLIHEVPFESLPICEDQHGEAIQFPFDELTLVGLDEPAG